MTKQIITPRQYQTIKAQYEAALAARLVQMRRDRQQQMSITAIAKKWQVDIALVSRGLNEKGRNLPAAPPSGS